MKIFLAVIELTPTKIWHRPRAYIIKIYLDPYTTFLQRQNLLLMQKSALDKESTI